MIASDNFDRPDADLHGSITNSYAGGSDTSWGVINGSAAIEAKHAKATQGAATVTTLFSDIEALASVRKLATVAQDVGLIVRSTDFNNMWVGPYLDSDGATVKLWKREAGVWSEVASAAFAHVADVDYTLRAVTDGTTIRCYVNGSILITYTTATFNQIAGIAHGLFWSDAGSDGAEFDNYILRELSEEFMSSSTNSSLSSSST